MGTSNTNAQNYPGKDVDLQGYIDQKISVGKTNITIQPEQYWVKPTRGVQKIKLMLNQKYFIIKFVID